MKKHLFGTGTSLRLRTGWVEKKPRQILSKGQHIFYSFIEVQRDKNNTNPPVDCDACGH